VVSMTLYSFFVIENIQYVRTTIVQYKTLLDCRSLSPSKKDENEAVQAQYY